MKTNEFENKVAIVTDANFVIDDGMINKMIYVE
jgi:hypothetical protein